MMLVPCSHRLGEHRQILPGVGRHIGKPEYCAIAHCARTIEQVRCPECLLVQPENIEGNRPGFEQRGYRLESVFLTDHLAGRITPARDHHKHTVRFQNGRFRRRLTLNRAED